MKFRKIGTWSVNRRGPNGSCGVYVEADLPPTERYRYAAVDPSYADLWEKDIRRLYRGEAIEIPALDEEELVERIDQIELR